MRALAPFTAAPSPDEDVETAQPPVAGTSVLGRRDVPGLGGAAKVGRGRRDLRMTGCGTPPLARIREDTSRVGRVIQVAHEADRTHPPGRGRTVPRGYVRAAHLRPALALTIACLRRRGARYHMVHRLGTTPLHARAHRARRLVAARYPKSSSSRTWPIAHRTARPMSRHQEAAQQRHRDGSAADTSTPTSRRSWSCCGDLRLAIPLLGLFVVLGMLGPPPRERHACSGHRKERDHLHPAAEHRWRGRAFEWMLRARKRWRKGIRTVQRRLLLLHERPPELGDLGRDRGRTGSFCPGFTTRRFTRKRGP
jgi:hypothetical protein